MLYPPAPWNLQGYAISTLNFVEIEKTRFFIPRELQIISVLPGKTLGTIYLASYETGSTLKYHELIVAPALVRYQGIIGSWITHIYVDNEDSVAGGREIWGLPKEIAEFTWRKKQVIVYQNNQKLCELHWKKSLFNLATWWRQSIKGKFFSVLNSELLLFEGQFKFKIQSAKANLTLPPESPFSGLQLGQPLFCVSCQQLQLLADVPQVVGRGF